MTADSRKSQVSCGKCHAPADRWLADDELCEHVRPGRRETLRLLAEQAQRKAEQDAMWANWPAKLAALNAEDAARQIREQEAYRRADGNLSAGYLLGVCLFGGLSGIATWLYAIAKWGFLLGVGFGWIPAAVVAFVVGWCWPIVLFLLFLLGGWLYFALT
jgi:hypothetical protein